MTNTIRSAFLLIGLAVASGIVLGIVDIAAVHRSSLKSYRAVQIGESWNEARSILQRLPQDCATRASSSAPPSLLHCSDYWWTYSFRFDLQTGRSQGKRFSPGEHKPFPFWHIR